MTRWDVRGKTCVVTGANSGIGRETALSLARKGAHVVMVCRSEDRGEAARAEIAEASGSDRVELMLCDMASFTSMRDFAHAYRRRYDRLDVLVNNAGMMFGRRTLTEDGVESTFHVNQLGYFMVTNLLLDVIIDSAPARIVSVASTGHKWAFFDWGNLQGERIYHEMLAYCISKLCNVAFNYELARRLEGTGVTANCLHPGAVGSSFGAGAGPMFRSLMKLGRPFLLSNREGAATSIYLASSPEVSGVSGRYFAKSRPVQSSRKSRDRASQERLWELCARLTGLGS